MAAITSNIPPSITAKQSRQLHNRPNHPVEIIKRHIYQHFANNSMYKFNFYDNLDPVVTTADNFDNLLIPADHPARAMSDTYYVDKDHCLRTHTSAHQNQLLATGQTSFIVTGDVYRKDEIDAHHYPVFHQMEIFTLVDADPVTELTKLLTDLITYLFPGCESKITDDYFPFTHPSFQADVKYNGTWLEILGSGVVRPEILARNGLDGKRAIAVGLGLDRLALIFCAIPDIRYLWSEHERFLSQYADGKLATFQPYSTVPSIYRDISFYIKGVSDTMITTSVWPAENDFFDCVRNLGETIGEVKLLDTFCNPKSGKVSRTYRIHYTPIDPTITNPSMFKDTVDEQQNNLRQIVANNLDVELR